MPESSNVSFTEWTATSTTYTYDAANQLETSVDDNGTTTYTYDEAGNLELTEAPGASLTTNTWDDENRRATARTPTSGLITSTYNGDGLRVRVQELTSDSKFIWDGQNYLMSIFNPGTPNEWSYWFTNAPRGYGDLVSIHSDVQHVESYYYQFDGLGSTVRLSRLYQEYIYDAFGNTVYESSPSPISYNPFQYIGRLGYYHNPATLDYYVRARTYDPRIARWLSRDPIGFRGGINLYPYVAAHPLDSVDPSGTVKVAVHSVKLTLLDSGKLIIQGHGR